MSIFDMMYNVGDFVYFVESTDKFGGYTIEHGTITKQNDDKSFQIKVTKKDGRILSYTRWGSQLYTQYWQMTNLHPNKKKRNW